MEQPPQRETDGERRTVDEAGGTAGPVPVLGPLPPRALESSPWTSLVEGAADRESRRRTPTVGRVVGRFVAANLVGVVLLLAGSVWASRQAAQDEALSEARHTADLIATLLVEPHIGDDLPAGDAQAVARLDDVLRGRLASAEVMRVKIWAPDGRIVYSDEPRLVGAQYPLSKEDQEALEDGVTRAELSDLSRPENRYERSEGQVLEVYRVIRTPSGAPLLFETYSSYDEATSRERDIWLRFAPISAGALLILLLLQIPLARRMVVQLRAGQREREQLQARVVDTSTEERRRIAGSLHDGIVQDVSASALLVAGAADRLRSGSTGRSADVADVLGQAATALRESVGSLRSLLVEIYPPNLRQAGLAPALADLAARLRPRGVDVRIHVPESLDLPPQTATLMFRVAQEALLNVAKHADSSTVEVTVTETESRHQLQISDDGIGFDLADVRQRPRQGHLGLSLLTDLAAAGGADLAFRTAAGDGTCLRLEVPRP
ncbi:MAG: putative signal transduction histidine kinase [Blastococcus sp.]|jgi:two-component system NarL family sensor kinase|nr:putative signal transduction histidine kinase [Blastococcus sp.]